ncbi:hypothetical protein [Micromonospora sp. ATA51]|uniref:hypothetical protein n=1 Tax=Micromonospora sp. ATA51 TaxID=2806098 RepID=UPI001A4DAC8B|nr:hypothetical protein [Micromonospora sp. ATA51]MBM0224881.1 hypothetical protein [Micromonospora sp. ATA51]
MRRTPRGRRYRANPGGLGSAPGASGVLAGRTVWASVVGSPTMADDLRTTSVDRLRRLADVVDDAVSH